MGKNEDSEDKQEARNESPVSCKGYLWSVRPDRMFYTFTADRGRVAYQRSLGTGLTAAQIGGSFMFPLALAGSHLYVSCPGGRTWELDPDAGFVEVACHVLEPTRSAPVFDGSRIYARCSQALY